MKQHTIVSTILAVIGLAMSITMTTHAETGFESLFDGRSLTGWDGDPQYWRVADGAIVGRTTVDQPLKKNTYLAWQGGEVADFELRVEFQIVSGNSGIIYRGFPVPDSKWDVGGYQADMSADQKWTGAAYGDRHKNLLAARGEKTVIGDGPNSRRVIASVGDAGEILAHIKPDDWNEYRIIANGNQCIQLINGVVTAEFSEEAEDRLRRGLVAFQLHSGPPMEVRFRNIRLRRLQDTDLKKVLFLAGRKSHGYGAHEHNAGSLLLARCLNESGLDVIAQVTPDGGWPDGRLGYDQPDTVVMYCDGFRSHLAKNHQDKIQALVDAGTGVACLHFGVEVEPEELGREFLDWIGGYFEVGWSVNPHWTPTFDRFPDHPACRGVQPFTIRDEWYYHMRFRPQFENTTALLSALPPLETLDRKGPRGTNPTVQAAVEGGVPQVVSWAYERPGGGRGFGFTGGHFHENWRQDYFRKLVLNALAWTAGAEIPANGIPSRTPSDIDMELNQDYPKPEPKK